MFQNARKAWKALNGLVSVYKPADMSVQRVRETILAGICEGLNESNVRPPKNMVEILGATNAPMQVELTTDLSDHPLVVGPRYQMQDIKSSYGTFLGRHTSGVFLLGLNEGTKLTYRIHQSRAVRSYKVHGKLGSATDTYHQYGKVCEKANYKHVTRGKIDRVVAYMQAIHQRKMYEMAGVDMESQAAYKLATMGVIRPPDGKLPILYGIKCVSFTPPNFTLEIQSINEYEMYLFTIIHDVGLQLKTVAHCTGAQCIRHGSFTIEDTLLRKHWKLPFILESIEKNWQILNENSRLLKQTSAALA